MNVSDIPAQVDQAVVRSNALLTIVVSAVAIATAQWWITALLAVDFFVRGVLNPRVSVLSMLSGRVLAPLLPFPRKKIFFPPKRFAARVGLVFATTATVLFALGVPAVAIGVLVTLIVFAALECFLNICMGCIVYDLLIAPHRRSPDLR